MMRFLLIYMFKLLFQKKKIMNHQTFETEFSQKLSIILATTVEKINSSTGERKNDSRKEFEGDYEKSYVHTHPHLDTITK